MTTFPRSPRLTKGAIITTDPLNPLVRVIIFQYTPDTLTRSLTAQTSGDNGAREEALHLAGPPVESIRLEAEIDATDQLEKAEASAIQQGIYPQLSALEMLLYPNLSQVIANTASLALGTLEIIPPEAPLTLFVWGPRRILPIRLTEFSITEEAYDPQLNPIRARVSLGLRVLNYQDLGITRPGYHLFLAHQAVKETLARLGTTSNLGAVGGEAIRTALTRGLST